jgi:DNA-binding NarL/FixJ family response regulator
MIDVQLVDDHVLLTEGISRVLNESKIVHVSNMYNDLDSCRKGLETQLPDILLLDIELPDGDGIEFCGELHKRYPELKIIMLTSYNDSSIARRALQAGAAGYVVKTALSEEILTAIQEVYDGQTFICQATQMLLLKHRTQEIVRLTPREKEVVKAIALGLSNDAIAESLCMSPKTVKSHRQNLRLKFNVNSSWEVVKRAMEQKLI